MSRRSISAKERLRLFVLHRGICHFCNGLINGACEAWDISHEIPLALGGADDDANRMPAHRKCHQTHTAANDAPDIAKAKRREAKHAGARTRSRNPLPGSKASGWKRRMDGTTERRV